MNSKNDCQDGTKCEEKAAKWTGGDLNPRLPPCELDEKELDWENFRKFLSKRCCKRAVEDRIRYVKKFSFCLFTNDFSIINGFSDCKRGHVLNALSAL